ncbi:hypothetical protein [Heyndrickxia oleronia]|nr:hypothetical protein [Heyndrickxia oleronia]
MIFLYKAFLTAFWMTSKQVSYMRILPSYMGKGIGEKNVLLKD